MKELKFPSPLNKLERELRRNNDAYNKLIEEYEGLDALEKTEISREDRQAIWEKKRQNMLKRKKLEEEHREIINKHPM